MYAKTFAAAILALSAAQSLAEPSDYETTATTKANELRAIADANPALSIQETEQGDVDAMVMLSDVLFEFGKSDLNPAALVTLETIAAELGSVEGLKIIGHTDDIGPENKNHALGLDRAKAVRTWIANQTGLSPDAIAVDSAGETRPIAANQTESGADNAEGRKLNRRVEFKIVDEKPAEDIAAEQAAVETGEETAGVSEGSSGPRYHSNQQVI